MKKITQKLFEEMVDDAYRSDDWSLVIQALKDENRENILRQKKNYPLCNIAIEELSNIALERITEDISYEDYLTEEESETYRLALDIDQI